MAEQSKPMDGVSNAKTTTDIDWVENPRLPGHFIATCSHGEWSFRPSPTTEDDTVRLCYGPYKTICDMRLAIHMECGFFDSTHGAMLFVEAYEQATKGESLESLAEKYALNPYFDGCYSIDKGDEELLLSEAKDGGKQLICSGSGWTFVGTHFSPSSLDGSRVMAAIGVLLQVRLSRSDAQVSEPTSADELNAFRCKLHRAPASTAAKLPSMGM